MTHELMYCLYCQEKLQGRRDKKFCNLYCKSAYHNKNEDSQEAFIKDINKQLRCNRSALRKACPLGKATVRKDFLSKLGMDFKYHTHTWKSASNIYKFCYDYGYAQVIDQQKVLIIQEQNYMKE